MSALAKCGRGTALGLGALVVVVAALIALLVRQGPAGATVRVAPLTPTDHRALSAVRPLVTSLPRALAQVPQAASDATGGRVGTADALRDIGASPALGALSSAITRPDTVAVALRAAYAAVVAGRAVSSGPVLASALMHLQSVEGAVLPAVRLVALRGGRHLSAAAALRRVESDRRAPDLARLLADWQQVYGAFVLVGQAAA